MANYQHIFISGRAETELFRTPTTRGGQPNIPQSDRISHSAALLNKFDAIWKQQQQLNQQRQAAHIPTREGT